MYARWVPGCFIAFQQDGFWCRDEAMSVWGCLLAQRIGWLNFNPQPAFAWARQDWARQLAVSWIELATQPGGQVTLQLADYLETPARRDTVLLLGRECRGSLHRDGLDVLDGLAAVAALPLRTRDPDDALTRVLRAADTFLWLLGGPRSALPAELADLFNGDSG